MQIRGGNIEGGKEEWEKQKRKVKTPILGVNFYQMQVTKCTRYTNISVWPKPRYGAWNRKHFERCFGNTPNASMEYTNRSA